MKWVIDEITRETISSLNVWLAQNSLWEPIGCHRTDGGWTMIVRREECDVPPALN